MQRFTRRSLAEIPSIRHLLTKVGIASPIKISLELLAMSIIKSLFTAASLVAMIGGVSSAQDCNSCGEMSYGSTVGVSSSTSSNSGGRFGSGINREHRQSVKAENHLITARNDAWPKPFQCADRQRYHEMFAPMIDAGFEEQCLLNGSHFDSSTNELNAFGKHAVAGIMQNMPSHRKQVFVTRDANEAISAVRLANVESVVKTFYGQSAPAARVVFSAKEATSVSGVRAELISQKYVEGQPTPNIPISAGGGSVAQSVGQ